MSKKKRRRKGDTSKIEPSNNNALPFGINPSQLMNMLGGNFDMGQIGNMLSNMKTDGLDLNNFNVAQGGNKNQQTQAGMNMGSGNMMNNMQGGMGGVDLGLFQNMMNNLGINTGMGNNQNNNFDNNFNGNKNSNINSKKSNKKYDSDLNITNENNIDGYVDDENIQMLEAIKKIVDVDKIEFIERIINAYNSGKF